jgi:imidazolonepropionase-like amidohydrolase
MPGLIDAHVHAWGPLERTLSRYALFGVTTALEMECDGDGLVELHEVRKLDPAHCAQLFSAGFPVTVPGGHGTEYGFPVPTVSSAAEIDGFVAERCAEGADYIKIIFNDPERSARTLSVEMVRAAVEAAHSRGKAAAAHVNSARAATQAIECGVDGLAHVFNDPAGPEFAQLVAERGAYVIPTLAVLQSADGKSTGGALATDPRLAPFLTSFDHRQLRDDFPSFRQRLGLPQRVTPPGFEFENALATVRALKGARVPILAGTDAPNPGTTHGASLHHELALLVEAGLSTAEALAAATSVPAARFGLGDRGRIAPGMRADLLLVRGDAESDIEATRDIARVWKAGVEIERLPR